MSRPDWQAIEARGGEVVRPVRWKLMFTTAALVAGLAFAAALLVLFASDGVDGPDAAWTVVWGLLATLWSVLAVRNLRALLTAEPLVGYDEQALYLPGVGAVEWHEISHVRVDEVGRGRHRNVLVGIYLHEPRRVLARSSLRRRLEGRLEASAKRAPLAVHHYKLPLELWVLAQRIERRREAAMRRAGRPPAAAADA